MKRFELKMKSNAWKETLLIFAAVLLTAVQVSWGLDKSAPQSTEAGQDTGGEAGAWTRYGRDLLSGLAGDIQVPQATVQHFDALFQRHKPELERLANRHQDLLWEALAVVIEVLPSFQTKEAQAGQIRVPLKAYAKASNLLERCESMASPELARDMRKAKALVEGMVKESDQESLVFDLKK